MSFDLRKFFRNISYLYGVNILSSGILFVQGVILIRYLGSENYGMWSLARSLPGMIYILADLGVNSLILREIAHEPTRENIEKQFGNTIFLKIFLSLIFLIVVVGLTLLLHYPPLARLLIWISTVSYIAITFAEVVIILFKARENFRWQALYTLLQTIGIFLIVVIHVLLKSSIVLILGSVALYQIVLFLGFFLAAWRYFRFHWRDVEPLSYQLLLIRRAIPFALIGIMTNFFYEVDTVMLSKMASFQEVGVFNAANRLIHAFLMFPLFLGQVLFPTLSYLFRHKQNEFIRLVLQMEKYVVLITFPLTFLFYRYADVVVRVLFGEKYLASILPLQILTFSLLFYFISVTFTVGLNAAHREKWVAGIITGAALVKIVLNALLIPSYGSIGASLGVVGGELTLALGSAFYFFRNFAYRLQGITYLRYVLITAPLLLFLVPVPGWKEILLSSLILLVYIALVFHTGLISTSELHQLREKLFSSRS